jgi:hypothetical protein
MKLTDAQAVTLYDVRDGKVKTTKDYNVTGARADVLRLLEERGLIEIDWDSPVGLRERSPAFHTRYPVQITATGTEALNQRRQEM